MHNYIELPIYGQLGSRTMLDTSVHPPTVLKLHIVLDAVPKSSIFGIFPAIIVSAGMAQKLVGAECTGIELKRAEFEFNEQSRASAKDKALLPSLRWCHVFGRPYSEDFGFAHGTKLIISTKVKKLIGHFDHEGVRFFSAENLPSKEEITDRLFREAREAAEKLKENGKKKKGVSRGR
jgi:hypothetical protein